MAHKTTDEIALADLRKRLGSANSDTRYQAYLDAQQLCAERLWEVVAGPAQQARKTLYRQVIGCFGCLLWCLALALMKIMRGGAFLSWPFLSGVFLCWLAGCFCLVFRRDSQEELCVSISRLLQHLEDARFAGPLLLIHAGTLRYDTRFQTRHTLLRLLPLLNDTHTQIWTAAQKAALLELARDAWGDLELKFAALDALAQVGEMDAVRVLRELADMQTASIAELLYSEHLKRGTTVERQVERMSRQAAEGSHIAFAMRPTPFDCLPSKECEPYMATALYLQRKARASLGSIVERQERQRQTALLLRSAEQPDEAQAQALLRPACSTGADTPGEQLLRPK